jgi:hypothetical protein
MRTKEPSAKHVQLELSRLLGHLEVALALHVWQARQTRITMQRPRATSALLASMRQVARIIVLRARPAPRTLTQIRRRNALLVILASTRLLAQLRC